MFRAIARALANLAILAVCGALIVAGSLCVLASVMLTWPVLRKSPRDKRLRASIDLAAATMSFLSTMPNRAEAEATLARYQETDEVASGNID